METKSVASQALQGLWTQVTPVSGTGYLRNVIFAEKKFYAVGGNGTSSTTQLIGGGNYGTAWSSLKNVIGTDSGKVINKLYNAGDSLTALSQSGSITTSDVYSTSSTWTDLTARLGMSGDLQDTLFYTPISGSQNAWLVVGSNGKIYACFNDRSGKFERANPFTSSETVYCANGVGSLLAVAGSNGKLCTAPKIAPANPSSFTVRNSTFGSSDIYAMKLCNGRMYIVGAGGKMAYSADLTVWTAVADTSFAGTAINDIAYGNGKYVAVGDGGKTAVSTDGVNWTQQANTFEGSAISSVAYGNGNFVAVGGFGKIAYWTP